MCVRVCVYVLIVCVCVCLDSMSTNQSLKRKLISQRGNTVKTMKTVDLPTIAQRGATTDAAEEEYQAIVNAMATESLASIQQRYYNFVQRYLSERQRDDLHDVLEHRKPYAALTKEELSEFWCNVDADDVFDMAGTTCAIACMFMYDMPMAPHVEVYEYLRHEGVLNSDDVVLTLAMNFTLKNRRTTQWLEYLLSKGYDWNFQHSHTQFWLTFAESLSILSRYDVAGLFHAQDDIEDYIGFDGGEERVECRPETEYVVGEYQWIHRMRQALPLVAYYHNMFKFCIAEGCPFDLSKLRAMLPFSLAYMFLYYALEEGVQVHHEFSCDAEHLMFNVNTVKLRIAELELAEHYGYRMSPNTYKCLIDYICLIYDQTDHELKAVGTRESRDELDHDENELSPDELRERIRKFGDKRARTRAQLLAYVLEKGNGQMFVSDWCPPRVDLTVGRIQSVGYMKRCAYSLIEVYADALEEYGFDIDKNEKLAKTIFYMFNNTAIVDNAETATETDAADAHKKRTVFAECFPKLCEKFLFKSKYYKTKVSELVLQETSMATDVAKHVLLNYM